jgi:hypothetical protein
MMGQVKQWMMDEAEKERLAEIKEWLADEQDREFSAITDEEAYAAEDDYEMDEDLQRALDKDD